MNGAIVAADISQSFEEYLEIFDHFYAEDIEGTTDTMKEPVHGKAAVRTRLAIAKRWPGSPRPRPRNMMVRLPGPKG